MKVYIHPATNIIYSSFYIKGLQMKFGKQNVFFSKRVFSDIPNTTSLVDLLFVVEDNSTHEQTRYALDLNDSYQVNDDIYQWCDVYGHCNANNTLTHGKYKEKLVSLCPSFGIREWNSLEISTMAISNLIRAQVSSFSTGKKFLGKYKRTYTTRRPLQQYYEPTKHSLANYVFFCSTLWYNDEWNKNDEGVNLTRANFIRACKSIRNLDFEGGLVPQNGGRSSVELFKDCLYSGVAMDEWLEKTKQSAIVFNTPAFWNCHGWKLGEYLALGKCIISTPLSNDLPAPLVHGKHIHFVENTQNSMRDAIEYILSHPEYQHKLEQGAKDYWAKYGNPLSALHLLGL